MLFIQLVRQDVAELLNISAGQIGKIVYNDIDPQRGNCKSYVTVNFIDSPTYMNNNMKSIQLQTFSNSPSSYTASISSTDVLKYAVTPTCFQQTQTTGSMPNSVTTHKIKA